MIITIAYLVVQILGVIHLGDFIEAFMKILTPMIQIIVAVLQVLIKAGVAILKIALPIIVALLKIYIQYASNPSLWALITDRAPVGTSKSSSRSTRGSSSRSSRPSSPSSRP